jgi:glycosyltransferase involved in cell wall biosynthesis
MRIAGITRAWIEHTGASGMEVHASNLYYGLAGMGHDVHVFTSVTDKIGPCTRNEGNLTVHYIPSSEPGRITGEFRDSLRNSFEEANNKEKFSVIHAESIVGEILLDQSIPIVVTWHGVAFCALMDRYNEINVLLASGRPLPPTMEADIGRCAQRVVSEIKRFKSFNHHVAISDQAYRDLTTVYGLPKSRVSLVYNGFNTGQLGADPQVRDKVRSELGISTNEIVIGLTGRIVASKGHRLFIAAYNELAKRHDNLVALIVGSGSVLEEYNRNVDGRCIVTGKISYDRMAGMYNAMDIFTNPTTHYLGLDSTIIEAMICGRAICASDVGSIGASLIQHEKTGLIFPLTDFESYVDALESLIVSPDKRSQYGEQGFLFAKDRFSIENMCCKMTEVLTKASILHK